MKNGLEEQVQENTRKIASLEEEVEELKKENSQMKSFLCKKYPEADFCK